MRKSKLIILLIPVIMWGCFKSMPVINESFLQNKNSEDLTKIKSEIVAKNNEIEDVKKTLNVIDQKVVVINRRIDFLKAEKPMLDEYIKLYLILGNNEKLGSSRQALAKNSDDTGFQKLNIEYHDLMKEYQEILLEVRQAELNVMFAELELEKAYILKPEDSKTDVKAEAAKKDKTLPLVYKNESCKILSSGAGVDVCSIIETYEDRKKKVKDIEKEKNKIEKAFQKSEIKIKASGKGLDF